MKFPREFYEDVNRYRHGFGEAEYNRDDVVPGVMKIITRYSSDPEAWKREVANRLLDDIEKHENKKHVGQADLFSYDAHVALGDKMRIKRGCMNKGQHFRRKMIIDRNKISQDEAWADETRWLNDGLEALYSHSAKKERRAVLNEDGTVRGEPVPA